jgi:hypothetical protein
MKKILVIVILAVSLTTGLSAQVHRFTIGLFGGAHTMLADSSLVNTWGPSAGLNFRYAYMMALGRGAIYLGPRTGIEASWAYSGWYEEAHTQFTNTDYLKHKMEYDVYSKVTDYHHQLYIGIPIMAELKYYGLVAALGFKGKAVLWTQAKSEINKADINAYYPDFDVWVRNDPSIGELKTENSTAQGARLTPEWHVTVAAEIGYEWKVVTREYIGVRLFAECDIWNSYKRNVQASTRSVNIAPIDVKGQAAQVSLTPLYDSSLNKFHALTIGLSVYYTFDSKSKRHHCNCLPY